MSIRRFTSSLIALAVLASPAAFAAEFKVGVVDTQAILAQIDDGKAAQARLEKWRSVVCSVSASTSAARSWRPRTRR